MSPEELRAHLAERHGAVTNGLLGLDDMHRRLHEWTTPESDPHEHTASGKMLTDADFEALADEAEKGYDISRLRPRDGSHDST